MATVKAGMDDMIAHIEYIAELVGMDHVGVSADSDADGWPQESGHYADADLAALDRWVRLAARLRARGWTEEDLAKLPPNKRAYYALPCLSWSSRRPSCPTK